MAQVVDGGKRRRVGILSDPEKKVEEKMPLMLNVGSVRWREGIGGMEAALCEAEVGFCDGTRWLVGEEELDRRRKGGSLASTVVVRVRRLQVVRALIHSDLWVEGYWCSVKRFVAVQPRRKQASWMKVVDKVKEEAVELEEKMGKQFEGSERMMRLVLGNMRDGVKQTV